MVYPNNNDFYSSDDEDSYSSSDEFYSDDEDFNIHSNSDFRGQTSATEVHGTRTSDTFVNRRDIVTERHALAAGSSDNRYPVRGKLYQPSYSYSHNYLPEPKLQLRPAVFPESDDSFATGTALEPRSVTPPYSNRNKAFRIAPVEATALFGRHGDDQKKSTTTTKDAHTTPQRCTGPTRTKTNHYFKPYDPRPIWSTKHVNTEEGPSTLPPRIPPVGPPTTKPPGGQSEITADAEKKQIMAEKDKTKKNGWVRGTNPRDPFRAGRDLSHKEKVKKLIDWAEERIEHPRVLTLDKAIKGKRCIISTQTAHLTLSDVEAIKAIALIKKPPGEKHYLRCQDKPVPRTWTKKAQKDEIREMFKDLSRYYPPEPGPVMWSRPKLLTRLLEDLEDHPYL